MRSRQQALNDYSRAYADLQRFAAHNNTAEVSRCTKEALLALRDLVSQMPSQEERRKIVERARHLQDLAHQLREKGADTDSDSPRVIRPGSDSQGWSADLFQKNCQAVAEIHAANGRRMSSGTGFIISEKGFLLTNHHVIWNEKEDSPYPDLRLSMPYEKLSSKMEVIAVNGGDDLALCRIKSPEDGQKLPFIPLATDYSVLQPGADVLLIGNTFSMGLSPINGIVRYTHSREGNLVYSVLSNHGDSGAPVLNRRGECVGINKSTTVRVRTDTVHDSAVGLANATPVDKIRQHLAAWSDIHRIDIW